MSLGISINLHIRDEVTTIETHAPESQTATVKVRDEDGYNGVTLFFNDLEHVERWVRDVLGRVEVAKMEAANDQPKPERRTVLCHEFHAKGYICTLPKGHWLLASSRSTLAAHLTLARRFREAEALLLPAERELTTALGEQAPSVIDARRRLVDLYTAWQRPAEVRAWQAKLGTPVS